MKDLSLLIWLSQLGFSVAFPLAGFILLAVWLRDNQGWGSWVLWVGIILGVICAFQGLRSAIRSMELLSKSKKQKDDQPPPVGFNDHH
jgi:phosphotransferase system  glucose/maltose/N-acetylglucosamine-specific IIC component